MLNWTWFISLLLTAMPIILISVSDYFKLLNQDPIALVFQIFFLVGFFFLFPFLTIVMIVMLIKIKKYCKKNHLINNIYHPWINNSYKKWALIYLKIVNWIVFISFLSFALINLVILPMHFNNNFVLVLICIILTAINLMTNIWFFYHLSIKVDFLKIK